MMLTVKDLSVDYGSFHALSGLSFGVEEGEWLMIAGPNGAGKSTVLAAMAGTAPADGEVLSGGQDLRKLKPAERARKIGMLSQNHYVGYSYTVEEVVRLGLYSLKGKETPQALRERVENALRTADMAQYRNRSVLQLSGGELQRTFLAQVLVQDPEILLLDEPTNHLDLLCQKEIFELIGTWRKQPGKAVISVVHDLSLAKKYGTRALLLNHGKCEGTGSAEEVLSRENLNRVYRMDVYEWMHGLHRVWEET